MNDANNWCFNLDNLERHLPKWDIFESPIEEILSTYLIKYVDESALISNQIPILTPNYNFRLDFLVEVGGKKFAFEANGKEYHSDLKDHVRAALILANSDIQSIYYLKGKNIYYNPEKVLHLISKFEPEIFSPRALDNFKALTYNFEYDDYYQTSSRLVGFFPMEKDDSLNFDDEKYEMHHKDRITVNFLSKKSQDNEWKDIDNFSNKHPEISIEELVERYFSVK